jgi:NAD(P)-dependent dehydrogenase (short-subunit alcohol dehydrogenase family)
MFDFRDKVAVVTGASGNLGSAVARGLQAAGARLILPDRAGMDKLEGLYPELVGSADHYLAAGVDLSNLESVEAMVREGMNRFGRIDILVNTVGGFRAGTPLHETAPETWEFMLNLNAKTIFYSCRAVIPYMLANGYGKIVNVSARAALSGSAGMSAYTASKSAVVRLTESMAADYKHQGLNANCVLPGTIDTPQNRKETPDADFSRWVQPEELANVILFLASDAGRAINGAAVPVYGRS